MSKSLDLFVKRLRAFMGDKEWTQTELAKASGVSRGQINYYLKKKSHPSLDRVEAIAKALNRPVSDFFIEEATLSEKTESDLQKEIDSIREFYLKAPRGLVERLLAKTPKDFGAIAARAFLTGDLSEIRALRLPEGSADLIKQLMEKNGLQVLP